jgi:hypothetical protein
VRAIPARRPIACAIDPSFPALLTSGSTEQSALPAEKYVQRRNPARNAAFPPSSRDPSSEMLRSGLRSRFSRRKDQ